jgi:hypothetical protein
MDKRYATGHAAGDGGAHLTKRLFLCFPQETPTRIPDIHQCGGAFCLSSASGVMGMLKTAVRTRLLDAPALPGLFERLNRVLPAVKEANMYATPAAVLSDAQGGGFGRGVRVQR